MEKDVFVINAPAESVAAEFALLVSRGSPFGGGGTAVFYIDRLVETQDTSGRLTTYQGYLGDDMVVAFPVGTAFIMAQREQVKGMTQLEYQVQEHKDSHEVHAALKACEESTAAQSQAQGATGKAVGQYL